MSNADSRQRLPKYLKEPTRIVGMTVDELFVGIVLFMSNYYFFDAAITGLIIGGGMVFFIKYLKKEEGQYFINQQLYWYLPNVYQFNRIPPSYQREYIG